MLGISKIFQRYYREQSKRIEKISTALEPKGTVNSHFPGMLFPWINHHYKEEYLHDRYRQPFEYDFILLVPPLTGRYDPSNRILMPWSVGPVRHSTLVACNNFIDVLVLENPSSVLGELKVPYRTSYFTLRQRDYFGEARMQVRRCVQAFMNVALKV